MRHLVVTNLDPGRIGVLIQPGLHSQAGAGVRGADQLDHGFVAHQRLPTPILGDGGKQVVSLSLRDEPHHPMPGTNVGWHPRYPGIGRVPDTPGVPL